MRAASLTRLTPLLLSPLRTRMMAGTAAIEVEKKFAAGDPSALRQQVEASSGKTLGEISFHDEYWDTAECVLTRRDTWLRRREQQWELKIPVAGSQRSGGETSTFTEIEGAPAVGAALATLLADWDGANERLTGEELEARLRAAQLTPFAAFGTVRSKYKLGGCSIDADVASFGHSVVEIEVMCAAADEVAAAESEIARVATLIDARPLDASSGGKLETFIRRFCPAVLAQLVEVGVLKAEVG